MVTVLCTELVPAGFWAAEEVAVEEVAAEEVAAEEVAAEVDRAVDDTEEATGYGEVLLGEGNDEIDWPIELSEL